MQKTRIIFIGGAIRAVSMFEYIASRNDVSIGLAIFMNGYENEIQYADIMEHMAFDRGIPHVRSDKITDDIIKKARAVKPQLILGGGTWRTILGNNFLNLAEYGYISMHGSGLPSYRGWCPLNWQIICGEDQVVSRMFQLNEKVDAGPLVVDRDGNYFEVRIDLKNKYYGEVLEELSTRRLPVYGRFLDAFARGEIHLVPQDDSQAFFGCNRSPEDGRIDWNRPTTEVYNFIRGQSEPAPGAFSFYRNQRFHIWRASIPENVWSYQGRIPGKVIERYHEGHVDVLTGDGILRLERITVEGKKIIPSQFIRSVRETLGFSPHLAFEELAKKIEQLKQDMKSSEGTIF